MHLVKQDCDRLNIKLIEVALPFLFVALQRHAELFDGLLDCHVDLIPLARLSSWIRTRSFL